MTRLLARIALHPDGPAAERTIVEAGELSVTQFRYESGVEAVRLRNRRGELVVLPWFGQMIWSAHVDGVDLTMRSGFDMPRPAQTIAQTYGCFAFHSGLLRNGVPGPGDDHPAHGEFPCAPLRRAAIELAEADGAICLRLCGERDHVVGFGPHYLARPSVTLASGSGLFDIALEVENRAGRPMELMYMCHVNFAFVPGGEIVQAAPFTPERTAVRRAVPAHVVADADYLTTIDALAADPARMRRLDEPGRYDPEQVFYIHEPATDATGETAMLLRRPQGDAFALSYRPDQFGTCVRWILDGPDQSVAAFALPATCAPEGYAAARARGQLRLLPPGGRAGFSVRTGYLDAAEAPALAARIGAMALRGEHGS